MTLPKIKHPLFKLVVPSTGNTINYRPFTVQEEKLLLVVKMSDDLKEVIDAVKQVINNCVVDGIDVDKLAIFDIEYIFINIRKVSISNVVELFYTHNDKKIPFSVDLDQVKVKFNSEHSDKIMINDTLGIKMKYPDLETMMTMEFDVRVNEFDAAVVNDSIFNMIVKSIDYIFDDDKVYKDFTKEEITEFLNSLRVEELAKIQSFFSTMPAVQHEVELDVGGEKVKVELRGMKDFFTY